MPDRPTGPIFVVGAAGSGTTLMRLILDSHDNLAIAQETGFARLLLANEQIPFWEFGDQWYARIGLTADDLDRRLRDFYGGLFADWAKQRGATRWGDKTPFHVWHLDRLARVFPDAVFIGLVRHPGAVAHSTRRRMGHDWNRALWFWLRDHVELLTRAAALGDRMALVRYEDLVADPEPVLRELFDWLGEPWSQQVLDFHQVHRGRGTAAEVEGATRSDKPIDPARVGAWVETMDEQRWARLRRVRVDRLTRALGYRADRPLPVRAWGPSGRTGLLRGSAVPALISAWPRVRWEQRPGPSFANRALTPQELAGLRRRTAAGPRPPRLERLLDGPVGDAGRRLLHALPPDARRPVRALLALTRR